jgi:hypothetical protein
MPKIQRRSHSDQYAPRKRPVRVVSMADLVEDLENTGHPRKPWVERFWLKVAKGNPDVCWPWKGRPMTNGYCNMSISNAQYYAHRLSFLIANGSIDPELFVIHSCDNRRCVNPSHLSQDTLQENSRQAVERNRIRRGERHGMVKLSEDEVSQIRSLYASGTFTQTAIADRFGVRGPQVCRIVNFKSRKRP